MDKRYQVFVSSTYVDLVEERREVIQALLELDCIPAGMEMFPATDQTQWELIQRVIDDCDYYIVIVGGRYGSPTTSGISYTEQEFDYAAEQANPILGFIHENPGNIIASKSEHDPVALERLSTFIDKVRQRPIRTFDSPDKLGSVVSRSLVKLIKQHPAEGWVKGRHALTPELSAESSELRARIAELELERLTASLSEPSAKAVTTSSEVDVPGLFLG